MNEDNYQSNYSKSDGFFVFMYLVFCFAWINVVIIASIKSDFFLGFLSSFSNPIFAPILVGLLGYSPVLFVMWLRLRCMKQEFSTVGIKSSNVRDSFVLGLQACVFILFIRFYDIPKALESLSNLGIFNIIFVTLYFAFIISFSEEVIFRAYIPSRLNGLIRNEWLRLLFVGLIFALFHIPNYGLQSLNLKYFVSMIIFHFFLIKLYKKYDNLTAPIMVHTLWNLMSHLNGV